jgi:hypothetical protein
VPDARWFIWGDEIDYRRRWLAAGYAESVRPSAMFFHPSDRQVVFSSNSKALGVPLQCSRLKRYCFYRNQIYLAKGRKGFLKSLGQAVVSIPDVWSKEPDKRLFVTAVVHGLFGVFGQHKNYFN